MAKQKKIGKGGQSLTTKYPKGKAVLDSAESGSGEAYDSKGRWLGFSDEKAINNAAKNGFLIDTTSDKVNDLSMWQMWNDAVEMTIGVMEAEDGSQFLALSDEVYLRVVKDNDGWSCEWLTRADLEERYYDDDLQCFRLKWTDAPFRLV